MDFIEIFPDPPLQAYLFILVNVECVLLEKLFSVVEFYWCGFPGLFCQTPRGCARVVSRSTENLSCSIGPGGMNMPLARRINILIDLDRKFLPVFNDPKISYRSRIAAEP